MNKPTISLETLKYTGPSVSTHLFEHDCDKCKFVHTTLEFKMNGEKRTEWYLCGTTLIARRSSEGHDYWSCDVNSIRLDEQGDYSHHQTKEGRHMLRIVFESGWSVLNGEN